MRRSSLSRHEPHPRLGEEVYGRRSHVTTRQNDGWLAIATRPYRHGCTRGPVGNTLASRHPRPSRLVRLDLCGRLIGALQDAPLSGIARQVAHGYHPPTHYGGGGPVARGGGRRRTHEGG